MFWPVIGSIAAGSVAGSLGSLLGLGGGFLLVPFFQFALGLPFEYATGLSLVTVVGTSMAVSSAPEARPLQNVRLATVLQVLTVAGAATGAALYREGIVDELASQRIFGVAAVMVALVMIRRLDRRNILPADVIDVGALGGRFRDVETGADVSYRVRRLPAAFGASFVAGIVSSLAGIGGGVVVVPALNSWCGVPLRVAASTSTFMLGVTAIPGVLAKFPFDDVSAPALAAGGVLGVLAGSRIGSWMGARAGVRGLKILLAAILLGFGGRYLAWGWW
jgi:uncharacterized membrane protein YfcA